MLLFYLIYSLFDSSSEDLGGGEGLLNEILSNKNVNTEEENIKTRFSDVLGIDEFKDELM